LLFHINVDQIVCLEIFKLKEEGKAAYTLLLSLFAGNRAFTSASKMGCWLVEAVSTSSVAVTAARGDRLHWGR
jgi:hypothetical protein